MSTSERGKLHLRFEPGEPIPQAGETVLQRGFQTYSVRIHRVIVQQNHPQEPGVTLLTVDATRRIVETVEEK